MRYVHCTRQSPHCWNHIGFACNIMSIAVRFLMSALGVSQECFYRQNLSFMIIFVKRQDCSRTVFILRRTIRLREVCVSVVCKVISKEEAVMSRRCCRQWVIYINCNFYYYYLLFCWNVYIYEITLRNLYIFNCK